MLWLVGRIGAGFLERRSTAAASYMSAAIIDPPGHVSTSKEGAGTERHYWCTCLEMVITCRSLAMYSQNRLARASWHTGLWQNDSVEVPWCITHLYTSTEWLRLLIGQVVELARILRWYVRTGVEITRRSALTIAA